VKIIRKILWKAYRVFIFKPYAMVSFIWPVWYYYVNRRSRQLFKLNPPKLNDIQNRIVSDLKKDGIAIAHTDELFPGKNILEKLQAYTGPLLKTAEAKTGKTFLEYLWEPIPILEAGNPFANAALDNRVVDIVNSYIGVYSRLVSLILNVTAPSEGQKARSSQRWHRDSDDKKICKMFIYVSDVSEENGPFIYLLGSQYGGKLRKLFPQWPPAGSVPERGAVEKKVAPEDIKVCLGKAGTVIFADTSGLHQGGYGPSGKRVMFTAAYYAGDMFKFPKPRYTLAPEFLPEFEASNPSKAVRYAISEKEPRLFKKFHHAVKKILNPKILKL